MREGSAAGNRDLLTAGRQIAVRGVGDDGEARWSYAAEVVGDDGDEIILRVREGEPVDGPEPWAWPADGRLHLWRSRRYSILATTRARRFPYWYCAVHTPATVRGDGIEVTDLALDVQLFADGRYSIGGDGGSEPGRAAVTELVDLMKRKAPPFNGLGPM
jgi:hypothetical protein